MKLLDSILSRFANGEGPLYQAARRYAWSIPIVAALGFMASLLEGVSIGILIPLLSGMSSNFRPQSSLFDLLYSLPQLFPPSFRLAGLALLILALILVRGMVQAGSEMLVSWVDGQVGHELRSLMARRLLAVGYPYFLLTSQVRLINAISTESWRASDAIRSGFRIVVALATIAVFSILLLLTNWWLFLAMAIGVAGIRMLQSRYNKRVARMSEAARLANVELAQHMVLLAFDLIKLVRLYNRQEREAARFKAASENVRRTMTHLANVTAWIGPMSELLYSVLFIGVLIGAQMSGIGLPTLIAFLFLMYRLQPHIRGIASGSAAIAAVAASIREVEWLIDSTAEQPAPTGRLPFSQLRHAIRFADVAFDYPARDAGPRAVGAVSFEIPARRWTALVGVSGAGKSTIVNMISRLLAPTSGRIMVDDVDLQEIDPIAWRTRLGVAGQDLDLFETTIAENIIFGTPGAEDRDIERVARLTGAHDFIMTLPKGYQTTVGERGAALSGGQRQRIGLARALVANPEILILDEATNALDEESESEIMEHLREISPPMTVVVISHRARTLSYCDLKVVLDEELSSAPFSSERSTGEPELGIGSEARLHEL